MEQIAELHRAQQRRGTVRGVLRREERVAREERTAEAGHALHRQVWQALPGLRTSGGVEVQALVRWLDILEKILHDEFLIEVDADGHARKVTRREKHEKGAYAIGSTVDPEATFRKHRDQHDLGYNVQVAAQV